jgi:hypothetical protein
MHAFWENIAKIYINLPGRKAEQISAAIFLLFHFQYRINLPFSSQKIKK